MAAPVELSLIGEKTLHHGANPRLLAYCPSMELLALGSIDQQVSLYRLNGQRVYNIAQKGTSPTVDRISWKPNGRPPKYFDENVTHNA
jgi:anaphase-promoting complex subunit 4